MDTIGKRIRHARNAKQMTQAELAERLGISRVSVTQWESDTTKPEADKFPLIAELLGGSADYFLTGDPSGGIPISDMLKDSIRRMMDSPNAKVGDKVVGRGRMIKVYGRAVGGVDGEFDMNGSVLYETMAPPVISEISNAYAIQVSGDSMSPRYEDGEICYVDPKRRVKRGDYVIAQIRTEEDGQLLAYVKRFIRHNAEELVLEQFNPAKELRFPAHQVHSVHYIAMAGNG